jgi:hypothetical protein
MWPSIHIFIPSTLSSFQNLPFVPLLVPEMSEMQQSRIYISPGNELCFLLLLKWIRNTYMHFVRITINGFNKPRLGAASTFQLR